MCARQSWCASVDSCWSIDAIGLLQTLHRVGPDPGGADDEQSGRCWESFGRTMER